MDSFTLLPNNAVEQPHATLRLSQVLGALRRNIGFILLCSVLAAVAAFSFAILSPSRYTAASTIAIDEQTFAIPELEGAVQRQARQDPMPLVRTEVQALMSRQLVQSVIDKLGIIHMPEFNPALRPPTLLHQLQLLIQRTFPAIALPVADTNDSAEAVMTEVVRALVVSQDNRSLVIGVSFTSKNPTVASEFVNDLIGNYLIVRSQRRVTTNQGANAEILQRVNEVRAGLSSLEQRMHDLRTKGELVSLRAGSIGQQQVEELAVAATRAGLVRAQLEAQFQPGSTVVTTARAREANAQRQLQDAREASVKAENAQAELNDVQQEVNSQRTLYQSLLQGMQRTEAQSTNAGLPLDVRILSSAVPPALPSSPNTKLAVGLGGGGGFVIGILIALTRVQSTKVFSTADDVTRMTGLFAVQLVAGRRRGLALLAKIRQSPLGKEAEALRLLRLQLQSGGHFGVLRSVLFVSPDDNDAASVAAAFAYVIASSGDKVVLTEGNLRGPRIAQLLGVKQAGLLDVLEAEQDWHEVLLHDPSIKLDLLVTRSAALATPLRDARFQNLLEDLHRAYHLTVLNGPSATSSDALVLASEANATVLVLRADDVTGAAVQEMAARLAAASRNRISVALLTAR